ncbi:hypothetical protein JCM3770_006479 [Rhodotorula araucariae]
MDAVIGRVQGLLLDFPSEQSALRKALGLADELQETPRSLDALSSSSQSAACASLSRLSELLTPPSRFCADAEDLDASARLAKDAFCRQVPALLQLAIALFEALPLPSDPPTRDEVERRARLLLAAGRFAYVELSAGLSESAAAEKANTLVDRLLEHPPHVRLPLLRHLLTASLPAFFKPHPKLNPSTGRVLARPLGGDRGLTDWFEGSEDDATSWRKQPGLGGVVKLVVQRLQPGEIEDLWPFLLPPLLAFLDDYEAANKLVGISILDALLDRTDESLLRRTGVGKVFEKSLENAFSALSDPLSPALLRAAHPVALKLLDVQHPAPACPADADEARFNALCALVAASVIHTWEFKGGDVALEAVTARALAPLVDALGGATVRYLQLLVPHVCGVLEAGARNGVWTIETAQMLCAAAGAARSVVGNGRARIGRWEGRVRAAIGRCWVAMREDDAAVRLRESQEGHDAMLALEAALKEVVRELEAATGSQTVRRNSVPRP